MNTCNIYTLQHYRLKDDGIFPNNDNMDVILYKGVLNVPSFFSSLKIRQLFYKNNWGNAWANGVYTYHHYHSIVHEVMGIYGGKTTLLLGGEDGIKMEVETGDVLLVPAGVAHKNLGKENQVKCVGAYPYGENYDMKYGKPDERPLADENIKRALLPSWDPVFGEQGEMHKYWKKENKVSL